MDRRNFLVMGAAGLGSALSGCAMMPNGMSVSGAKPAPAEHHKGYVDGPFGQIHYYRQGAGPALVMLHQSPVNGRMFERAMPYLAARGLSAIAMDAPGYGNSAVPPEPPTVADYSSAVGALLDGLRLKSAHLLGHHTGASVATHFAVAHPERVNRLILNGPPFFSDEDLERLQGFEHSSPEILEDGAHLQARWQRRAGFSKGWTDKEAMHRRVIDQLWAGETSWYGHHAAFNYDMRPDFDALTVPTMILTNTGDDVYDLAQVAAKRRPDMAYLALEGGTHDIVDEQPGNWAKAVSDFVLKAG